MLSSILHKNGNLNKSQDKLNSTVVLQTWERTADAVGKIFTEFNQACAQWKQNGCIDLIEWETLKSKMNYYCLSDLVQELEAWRSEIEN